PFGASLTEVAQLPPGSMQSTDDRFGERPSIWPRLALFIVCLCLLYSLLNQFYLVDKIAFSLTGQHWGRRPPVQQMKKSEPNSPENVGNTGTNAPPAAP
ncbi:MAG TPA: hypothetical protein VMA13_10460, partial [Candidatus Saccharimonadales bacterium]|nr:hypothetical protein [Candidatus Saccharimonadales bacterium]